MSKFVKGLLRVYYLLLYQAKAFNNTAEKKRNWHHHINADMQIERKWLLTFLLKLHISPQTYQLQNNKQFTSYS